MKYRISIPLNGGSISVLVTSNKKYGTLTGEELRNKYRGFKVSNCTNLETDSNRLFLPYSELTNFIRFKSNLYKTRTFFNYLERITGKKILLKRELRPVYNFRNTSISLPSKIDLKPL